MFWIKPTDRVVWLPAGEVDVSDDTEEAESVVAIVDPCEECGVASADKTDGEGRSVCERCAVGVVDPIRGPGAAAGRNEPCPCGSGKKFKRCCRR